MKLPFSFHDLSVGYGPVPALRNISGAIEAGKVTALIGPNGSGKSTLLKALAGLVRYQGSLRLGSEEIKDLPRKKLGALLGMVAQQSAMKADFQVYDVIALGRLPYQGLLSPATPQDRARVLRAAEQADIERLLFRRISELSGGERQRVFIALVLAQDPPVCLFDEPTSALDPRQSLKVFALLRELAALGKTVVAAVHDVHSALTGADAFLALREGSLIARGPVEGLDGNVLEKLYDVPFIPYISREGDTAWLPSIQSS